VPVHRLEVYEAIKRAEAESPSQSNGSTPGDN
jgi:sRNA-binding carbon storage regulator CsrA